MQTVTLYNQQGAHVTLPVMVWEEILSSACKHGWRPQGTAPPPIDFDAVSDEESHEPWNGSYVQPLGQMMRRADCQQLVEVLSRVSLKEPASSQPSPPDVDSLINLCRNGGLIIADVPPLALADQGTAADLSAIHRSVGASGPGAPEEIIPSLVTTLSKP